MRIVLLVVGTISLNCLLVSCQDNQHRTKGELKLVWSEDFNANAVDGWKWRITQQGANYNNEDQAYTMDQISQKSGCLVIRCEKKPWQGPAGRDDYRGNVNRQYVSGEINSRQSWKYGRVEVSMKVPPRNKGILSAVWMTPADKSWPPEIDIVEILGSHPDMAVFTNHWGTSENHRFNSQKLIAKDFSEGFHVYAIEWEEDQIIWYVDGAETASSRSHIPDIPLILRLSLPVGPDWEGKPDATSSFPQELLIDWIKVYSR